VKNNYNAIGKNKVGENKEGNTSEEGVFDSMLYFLWLICMLL